MDRRLVLAALACWPALSAAGEPPRPRHKISVGQLHEALSARFPVRFGIEGLLQVQVSAPALHLLPSRNRLGAGLIAHATGPALQQAEAGEADALFALRYEPQDRSVRAHGFELLDLRLPGVPPELLAALKGTLPALVREAVGEFVLHRFSERELALADTMGFQPERFTVVNDGLVIEFGPKPRR